MQQIIIAAIEVSSLVLSPAIVLVITRALQRHT